MAAFALERAEVRYGDHVALAAADLVVARGERVALIGPSGAGKTTLLALLNASKRPTRGRVLVGGRDLATLTSAELRAVRAGIGFVHQDHALVPNLRVSQNVLSGALGRRGFGAALRALVWPSRRELSRAHALLVRAGIGEKLFQRADRLSGGERQRVAIARALYQEPESLLADEPVSSVDPARARDTIALLTELSSERGLTLLVSIHDVTLAREFFPRLVGLRAGRIVFDARTETLGHRDYEALYSLPGLDRVERGVG